MGTRTEFEIRSGVDGASVFAFTSWWSDERNVRTSGGLACSVPFDSVGAAVAWVALQFEVPAEAWIEQPDGTMVASKGDTPIGSQTVAGRRRRFLEHKPGRRQRRLSEWHDR